MPESTRSLDRDPALAERVRLLEMSVQKDCSDLSSHEDICGERYTGLLGAIGELKAALTSLAAEVRGIATTQIANAGIAQGLAVAAKPKWWQTLAFGAGLTLFGWMAATIWSMEAAKVDALQSRPAAAVTVQAQPAQPAPVYPGPVLPANPSP